MGVAGHGVLSGIQQVQKCRAVGSSDQGGSSGESELLDESEAGSSRISWWAVYGE